MPESAYPSYSDALSSVPREPDLLEHLQMLNVLSREAGDRVRHRDGEAFRAAVFECVDVIGDSLSAMMAAHDCGDLGDFRTCSAKLSGSLAELSLLSEEGLEDVRESSRFFKMTEAVCKRVEKMEEIKTGRMSVMSERVVMKLVDLIPVVLSRYLGRERSQAAFAEILGEFKGIGDGGEV